MAGVPILDPAGDVAVQSALERHAVSRRPAGLRCAPFLAAGAACLLVGMAVGLQRAGWSIGGTLRLADHAPLMISGFLGTLIALERAVALRLAWAFLAPLASSVAGVALLLGLPRPGVAALAVAAAGILLAAYVYVLRLQPATFTATLTAGAGAWALGSLAWGMGLAAPAWVAAWSAFLVFTIVGERLELSRLTALPRWAWTAFAAVAVLHGVAVLAAVSFPSVGYRLSGVALFAWALWLLRFDLARRTLSRPGLPRFSAIALLLGYGWLGLAGILWGTSPVLPAGLRYDAEVHALLLGFVFSMIFAHAPIIWPSVLGGEIRFHPRAYVHLALLHASLLLRVASGLGSWEPGRRWAVVLNTLAILLFLAYTVHSAWCPFRGANPSLTGSATREG